jgi:hypothetical protein
VEIGRAETIKKEDGCSFIAVGQKYGIQRTALQDFNAFVQKLKRFFT